MINILLVFLIFSSLILHASLYLDNIYVFIDFSDKCILGKSLESPIFGTINYLN